jgi:hypothetical protein
VSVRTLVWKLASPYDAYVSHVSQLNDAIDRIRALSGATLAYEAGLQGSVRLVPSERPAEERAGRFRERLGDAAASMSAEEFEEFISHIGGGEMATVEADRAKTVQRMGFARRGLQEYFKIAGQEMRTLAERGFDPRRGDVRRQLEANKLPDATVEEYRVLLSELGSKVGQRAE